MAFVMNGRDDLCPSPCSNLVRRLYTLDVGNNNILPTLIKSNFPPYGRDFDGHNPTGRFSNGKLAIDFLGTNLLMRANFASAGSGYDDSTANLYLSLSLNKQLEYYKEFQAKVVGMVGEANASSIFSGGLYVISAGTSDFIQNYYISPVLQITYPTVNQYFNILLRNYEQFVENLYSLGARSIGVTSLPPLGCLPGMITLFGLGFLETRKGCCGTGLFESAMLCNALSIGTCSNASNYVFWDAFHPTEATNAVLAPQIAQAGTSLVFH
ncbi:hypothetical protein F8388_025633 [Cannabis sativa]|uniref:GDSL esterase/lipase n=1 Tax=Cannabis sativa TaxID=3483 RepID=A0A7J6G1T6_CANSA|nr:hypothetical protein F8388_025633 [Cannabis sativa]